MPDKANLSYSVSYSITKFLIETYGQEKMTQLLMALRDAKPIDDALIEVYGFDTDGLEDDWRQAIGAAPRTVSAQPTVQPTPTHVPTIVPVAGVPLAVTPTPFVVPTSSSSGGDGDQFQEPSGPPVLLTVVLICFCCTFVLILGVIILMVVLRSQKSNGGQNG
jgi:hypothetical protein